jgi:homoserine O-succinyltransferase/O-acetyltransferase
MPLTVEGSRVPTQWLERNPSSRVVPIDRRSPKDDYIKIALINNMPDAALEDTELQFFDLLDAASEDVPILVKLFSLTGVPRTDRGMRHLNNFYCSMDELWDSQFDALIMTGTEPQQANLRQEPYWPTLASVLDWAEQNTLSTILSCLAAHAGVLYSDGIERHRLSDKRFGVFDFTKSTSHALTNRTSDVVCFPHSRWNEVRSDALKTCGYTVLTESMEAGVDCFVKRKKKSLFVHFQGHPEYGQHTLLKEYRRDIKRFLRKERETYPTMPHGYFGAEATAMLNQFRERALLNGSEDVMTAFPEEFLFKQLQNTWRSSATRIYSNWMHHVQSRKNESVTFPVASTEAYSAVVPKPSVLP